MYLPRTLALFDQKTVTWAGRSGRGYDFVISRPGTTWIDEPAVYILVKHKGSEREPLFVGHTDNLRSRLGSSVAACPEEWRRALGLGMTQVHLRFEACSERARRVEAADLVAALKPVINEELARQPALSPQPARPLPAEAHEAAPLKLVIGPRARTRHAEGGKIAFPIAPTRADAHAPERIDMDLIRPAAVDGNLDRFFRRDPARGLGDDELAAPALLQVDAGAHPDTVDEPAHSIAERPVGAAGEDAEAQMDALPPASPDGEVADGGVRVAAPVAEYGAETVVTVPAAPAVAEQAETNAVPSSAVWPEPGPVVLAPSRGLFGRILRLFSRHARLGSRAGSDLLPPARRPVSAIEDAAREEQPQLPSFTPAPSASVAPADPDPIDVAPLDVPAADRARHAPGKSAHASEKLETSASSVVELTSGPNLSEAPANEGRSREAGGARPAPEDVDSDERAKVDSVSQPNARRELGLNPENPVVLFAGDLSHHAGADILMDAAVTVCSTHADVVFVYAGDGPLASDLRERAARGGLQSRCRFLGDVPAGRFPVVLTACDFVAIPARTNQGDALARMALEFGKPVLVTVQAGIGCVVHGHNGLVTYDNPQSFVWGVRELLGPIRNDLCQRLMKAA